MIDFVDATSNRSSWLYLRIAIDALTAVAYLLVPLWALTRPFKRLSGVARHSIRMLGLLVLLEGIHHVAALGGYWHHAEALASVVGLLTAGVSLWVLLDLLRHLSRNQVLANSRELTAINQTLRREIIERQQAEGTLRNLVACTVANTGRDFFSALVTNLAIALDADYVFVAQRSQTDSIQLKTIALWSNGQIVENQVYSAQFTPCETVLRQGKMYSARDFSPVIFSNSLLDRIDNQINSQINSQMSYLGVPLVDDFDRVIGVLGFYRHEPIDHKSSTHSLMTVFAARASAELQRQRAEQALKRSYDELELQIHQRTSELREAKETAEIANRAKSVFLAKMSHELRTPLNAILGFAQIMAQDYTLSKDHQDALSIINRSGGNLLGLINDILDVAKIEAGYCQLQVSEFDLQDLLKSVEETLKWKAEAKGLIFNTQYDLSLPPRIVADENKLRQILINLLDNAIKYTEVGQVTLKAELGSSSTSTAWLKFVIADTGLGVDLAEQDTIFQPFSQAQAGLAAWEGVGLGLSICQGFVQLMDGTITIDSALGAGTTFAVCIPVQPVKTSALPAPLPRKIVSLATPEQNYRVLIAEDSATNRLLLRKVLTSVGFTIAEAANGQEAIELWHDWQPDLIIMDMQMPILDGYQATAHIKQQALHTRKPAIPIIALTASTFQEQQQAILAAGCNTCIYKPFQREDLLATIGQYLHVEYCYEKDSQVMSAA
jgi:two-component system, sensor histidine kinase and response regulator